MRRSQCQSLKGPYAPISPQLVPFQFVHFTALQWESYPCLFWQMQKQFAFTCLNMDGLAFRSAWLLSLFFLQHNIYVTIIYRSQTLSHPQTPAWLNHGVWTASAWSAPRLDASRGALFVWKHPWRTNTHKLLGCSVIWCDVMRWDGSTDWTLRAHLPKVTRTPQHR